MPGNGVYVWWTEERKELLHRLAHSGLSASQIAKEMCASSKNAVISACHRFGAQLCRKKGQRLPREEDTAILSGGRA